MKTLIFTLMVVFSQTTFAIPTPTLYERELELCTTAVTESAPHAPKAQIDEFCKCAARQVADGIELVGGEDKVSPLQRNRIMFEAVKICSM